MIPISNPNNVQTNMGPNMETGPMPADPAISSATASYSGTGVGVVGQGTIGVGVAQTNTPQGQPAQLRAVLWNNQLYFVEGITGTAYVASATAQVPTPAVYSPTK